MGKKMFLFFMVLLLAYTCANAAFADTVYLKNGGRVKGMVVREDKSAVVIDIGGGTVVQNRVDVLRIERESAQDTWSPNAGTNYGIKSAEHKHVTSPQPKSTLSEVAEDAGNMIGSILRLDLFKKSQQWHGFSNRADR